MLEYFPLSNEYIDLLYLISDFKLSTSIIIDVEKIISMIIITYIIFIFYINYNYNPYQKVKIIIQVFAII